MTKRSLQNNPGYSDIPPKRARYGLAIEYANLAYKLLIPVCWVLFCGLSVVVLPTAGVIIAGVLDGKTLSGLVDVEVLSTPSVIFALVAWPLTLVLALIFTHRVKGINLREQRTYYAKGNVPELNSEQKTALRLTIVDGFNDGAWTQTLEYWPCEARVPELKRFKFLTLTSKNEQRGMLEQWWGIVNAKQYHDMVTNLLEGLHSKLFFEDAQSDQKTAMVERLAGLVQLPESYVEGCLDHSSEAPAKLLWGFDLYRIIAIARSAYMAGYISEEEAWSDILKAANYSHAIFDSYEDFYNSYRLGNAFWSNDFETAREKLERWQNYNKNCKWPMRALPWPEVSINELPSQIRDVFSPDQPVAKLGFI